MTDSASELTPGMRIPDFSLPATSGRQVRAMFYRNRRNLVIVLVSGEACEPCRGLLAGLAAQHVAVNREESEVLAIVHGSPQEAARIAARDALPYPVLVDADGRAHREFRAWQGEAPVPWVVYVTDRDGEIFAAYRAGDGRSIPAVPELLEWLSYLAMQCPE